jgi:hypothetical protein
MNTTLRALLVPIALAAGMSGSAGYAAVGLTSNPDAIP